MRGATRTEIPTPMMKISRCGCGVLGPAYRRDVLRALADLPKGLASMLNVLLAGDGQADPAVVANEQGGAEVILQIANAPADRRLLHADARRFLSEAAVLDSRKEVSELAEFDHGPCRLEGADVRSTGSGRAAAERGRWSGAGCGSELSLRCLRHRSGREGAPGAARTAAPALLAHRASWKMIPTV